MLQRHQVVALGHIVLNGVQLHLKCAHVGAGERRWAGCNDWRAEPRGHARACLVELALDRVGALAQLGAFAAQDVAHDLWRAGG